VALKQAGGVAHGGKGAVLDNLLADAAVARVLEHAHFDAVRLDDAGEPVEGLGVAAAVVDDGPGAGGRVDLGQAAGAGVVAVDER
jgi:hypothetical protein